MWMTHRLHVHAVLVVNFLVGLVYGMDDAEAPAPASDGGAKV
jgi:hypothetical protein